MISNYHDIEFDQILNNQHDIESPVLKTQLNARLNGPSNDMEVYKHSHSHLSYDLNEGNSKSDEKSCLVPGKYCMNEKESSRFTNSNEKINKRMS